MTNPDVDVQLRDLQERYAYLERQVDELNQVVADQGRLIERMIVEIRALAERGEPGEAHAERPPHY